MLNNLSETIPAVNLVQCSRLKKHVAGIIDASLIITLVVTLMFYFPQHIIIKYNLQRGDLYVLAVFVIYRLLSFFLFKRTIGMIICGIQLLNAELKDLTWKENICAAFFVLIHDSDYYSK